jgi:F-type H+-transporting ATPase subunit delta
VVDRALDVQPLAKNFAKVLVQKGRAGDARAVALAFGLMADEAEGIAHAEVVAAVDLSTGQIADIERKLSESMSKRVSVTATVDPSIMGGVIVKVGDRLVDGSIRSRLKQLKRELAGTR